MSWHDIEPVTGAGNKAAPVTLSGSKSDRFRPYLLLTVRIDIEPIAFWKLGARVRLQFGAGEHAGLLRVTPKGDVLIGKGTGSRGMATTVKLPWPPHANPHKHAPAACEFDYADDWLEVTLPAWARGSISAAPAVAAPAPVPALAPPAAKPAYVGVTSRVPSPDAKAMAARRARA